MAAQRAGLLETVLCRLCLPDNEAIATAEKELEELSKASPLALIPELMEQLGSQHDAARHMASVLLRKKLKHEWIRLPADLKAAIKARLMEHLFVEPVSAIQHAVAAIVSAIAKFELSTNTWPELLGGLHANCGSEDVKHREIGMYLMSQIADTASDQLIAHLASMFELFCRAFQDPSLIVATSAAKCLVALVPALERKHVVAFRALIPSLLVVVERCIADNNPLIASVLEVLNEAAESEQPLLNPHLDAIVGSMVRFGTAVSVDEEMRAPCWDLLNWVITHKSKSCVKKGLVAPILQAAAQCMSEAIIAAEEDDLFELQKAVVALIDTCATSIPPEIVLPILAPTIAQAIQDGNPASRHAGYALIQCVVDGCSTYIRTTETLAQMLQLTIGGVADPDLRVRQRGVVALKQLIVECQPEVCHYHAEILPAIIATLDSGEHSLVTSACYALESLIDGMGEMVLQYLDPMMSKLKALMAGDRDIQRAATSCIAMVAKSSRDYFLPYFDEVLAFIMASLDREKIAPMAVPLEPGAEGAGEAGDDIEFLCQLIDSLGCISVCLTDKAHIMKHVPQCMAFGLAQMMLEEPDVRGAIFCLFGSMATVSGDAFAEYLPIVVQALSATIAADSDLELLSGGEEVDDQDPFAVENDYVIEKQNAYDVLAVLADTMGLHFAPFIAPTLELVTRLRATKPLKSKELGHNTLRKANSATTIALAGAIFRCIQAGMPAENLPPLQQVLDLAIATVLHCTSEPIQDQEDVAAAGLDLLQQHLTVVGSAGFSGPEQLQQLNERLFQLLSEPAQPAGEDEFDGELEDDMTMLQQTAIDTVPHLAKAAGEHFVEPFGVFLAVLKPYGAPNRHDALRTALVGCFAEVIEAQGMLIAPHAPQLFEVLAETIKDEEAEVASNSAYALGVLCQAIGNHAKPFVPGVFTALYQHCLVRQFDTASVADNACAAVARIVLFVPESGISLDQVFPTLLNGLPLKEDYAENAVVYSCATQVFQTQYPAVAALLPQFLEAVAAAYGSEGQLENETRALLAGFIGWLTQTHADDARAAMSALPTEAQAVIATMLQ